MADGRIAFVGGCNLHDAERSRGGRKAIQDYHFRVLGPVVGELQYGFLQDWHMMTGEAAEVLLDAGNFIRTIETRQGLQVACLEEIAYENGWMTPEEIWASCADMLKTNYGQYLMRLIEK